MLIGLVAGMLCLLFGVILTTNFEGAATVFQRIRTFSWPMRATTRRRMVAEFVKMDQIFVGPALVLVGLVVTGYVLVRVL